MSIADWFVFKSKKEREAEQKRYRRFAFPYGDEQRARLEEIVGELMPSEPRETAMAIYLIGREGYRGSFKMDEEDRAERTEEEKLAEATAALRNMLRGKLMDLLPLYLAVVIADAGVDERLQYPSIEELRRLAGELERRISAAGQGKKKR